MNISSLNYTNSYQVFLVKASSLTSVRKFLSVAPLGNYLTIILLNIVIPIYTKIFLEISGLAEYTNELTKEEATTLHKQFNKFLSWLLPLSSQKTFFEKNDKTKEFGEIVMLLTNKVKEIMYLLDKKIHSHYTYSISTINSNNDWADAANDHWDNY